MGKNRWIWGLGVIGMFFIATTAMGQTVETIETVEKADSLWALLVKGGIVMIPLAFCSIVAVTITMERFISMGRKTMIPTDLDEQLDEVLSKRDAKNKISKAKEICNEHPSALSDVYVSALNNWDEETTEVDKIIGDVASLKIRKLRRSIRALRFIASVSPLLGLLGTIVGMIRAFQTVALSSQSINKAELLADGIYQAMVTTATGLAIAIPTLLVFFYFNNRIDKIGEEIEERGNNFIYKYFRSRLKLGN